jgi:agmatinase
VEVGISESMESNKINSGPFQGPWNFLGLREELAAADRARAWVLPIPYEGTTCYGAGTRNGPAAIIAASRQLERFDREFDCEPAAGFGVHTMSPLGLVHRSPEVMIGAIEAAVAAVLSGEKGTGSEQREVPVPFREKGTGSEQREVPVPFSPCVPDVLAVLGGEHTISAGVVRGLARAKGAADLVAVQIDAHADLHDEYEGSPYSHACAARRILETCPVFQIGIRNISALEERFRRQSSRVRTVFAEEAVEGPELLDELARFVRGKQVFLTIDLDGLDPSIMPAVGTPEPGGLSWARTLEVVRVVCRQSARLPVFDVVELAPIPAFTGPDFLAAKLVYKIISLTLMPPRA